MDWDTIWKLWPLVVILLGISLLIKHKYGKGFVAGLAALILALAIFASFKTVIHFFSSDFEIVLGDEGNYEFEITEYSEQFDSTLKYASFNFDAGAGSFNINESTEKLFDATTEGRKDNFYLKRFDSDSSSKVDFIMQSTKLRIGVENYKNRVDMRFNPEVVWELNFEAGAASMDFDLTDVKTKYMEIDMGAASLNLKLGDRYPRTEVNIDAGASDLDILIPEGSGCRVSTNGVLSSKNLPDFEKIDSGLYQTANFGSAQKTIHIEIDSGVSSITVERY
jgi:hypothetical protein